MTPIANSFSMPNTSVLTSHNLGGIGIASETDFLSETYFLSSPQFKRARTGTAESEERTPSGEGAEAELLLRNI